MNSYRVKTEALVIGSGIAGCTTALTLADQGRQVILLTSGGALDDGNSRLAQGGIIYKADVENPRLLENDILICGWKRNYPKAVRYLAHKGPRIVEKMLLDRLNVPFDRRDADGSFHLTKEGGHSEARIIHRADHTGQAIMEEYVKAVSASPNITVLTNRTAVDLLTSHHHSSSLNQRYQLRNQCLGAYVFNDKNKCVETILADFTVLATGGSGRIFLHTTNSRSSIGSALAMGARAGAKNMNMEFIQFHPTTFFHRADRRFLITEAMRGEGAKLVNSKGEAFMTRYDPRADLAPRDIVTRAILEEMMRTGEDCVYLDAAGHIKRLKEYFPSIYAKCLEFGVDITAQPIPVVPAAHYFCGGVLVDAHARTTLDRLYAAGECACTGLHGANRLASASLLECLLWGWSAGADISARIANKASLSKHLLESIPDWVSPGSDNNEDPALIAQDWATIRHTMWNYVGINRSSAKLTRAFEDLRDLNKRLHDFYRETPMSKPLVDLFHGCQAAYTITLAAMRNKQSLGCHYRVN